MLAASSLLMLGKLCYALALAAQRRQRLRCRFRVKSCAFSRASRRSVAAAGCARTRRPLAAAGTNPLTSGGPTWSSAWTGTRKTSTVFPSQRICFLLPHSSPPPAHPSLHPFFHNSVCFVCVCVWCARARVHGELLERESFSAGSSYFLLHNHSHLAGGETL